MAELVRFIERSQRAGGSAAIKIDARALLAMQQTGERETTKKGRGSQHFLQGGLSAPITITSSASSAAGSWRSTTLPSSGRSTACQSGSACAWSITTWCCAARASAASDLASPRVHIGPALSVSRRRG